MASLESYTLPQKTGLEHWQIKCRFCKTLMVYGMPLHVFARELACPSCGWRYQWKDRQLLDVVLHVCSLSDLEWVALGYPLEAQALKEVK